MPVEKYTSGPWKVGNNGKDGQESDTFRIWRNDPDQSEETNNGYSCISSHVHGIHNARLISAAPDLLEALQQYDDAFTRFDQYRKESCMEMRRAIIRAHAAIAKAKGE